MGEPQNILIIKPSALGDIVLALPALSALKNSFPNAKIAWMVRPEFADLLREHPDLDEIILFDRKLLGKSWYNAKAFKSLISLFGQIRKGRFDLVFDFQGLFRSAILGWISGCRMRLGMAGAREFAHFFYTHRIRQDSSCVHLVDYYLKIAAAASVKKEKVEFKFPEDAQAYETVKKLLTEHNVSIDNYIVMVPGAAKTIKRWPIERFAQLADKISSLLGYSIVAIGSQSEREYVETLKGEAESKIVNLAGQTSIRQLVALMRGASLVISNDTGPGHIAAALGVPIVMIFGPTNPARVCPYGRPQSVVAIEPTSRGMKADSYEPKHNIRHITVAEVIENIRGQIK